MRATPNVLARGWRSALSAQVSRQKLSTLRVSRGSITPSSYSRPDRNIGNDSASIWASTAARNAARVGSVTPAGACGTATSELTGNDVGTVTCELLENCATGTIRVRLTAQQTVSLPLVGDRNVTLHASSSYACPR